MHRRTFLKGASAAAVFWGAGQALSGNAASSLAADAARRLDRIVEEEMVARHIPGLSACLVHEDTILWQQSYGFGDLRNKIPMTADHIQNIASISKTFTLLAVMQQVEAGLISLDADVNDYLPFSLRHPRHPERSITARMLLQHRSALRDGIVYARHYACGDPRMSLGVWVRQLFEEGAGFYDANENFAPWAPGEKYGYANTTFGVLGYLVEITSGMQFPEYCERNIFSPLGMNNTGWMIADVDMSAHLVPYTWVDDETPRGPSWGGMPLGVIRPDGPTFRESLGNGYQENCAYNHPNYPDGFLRTSVNQLSAWARLWLNDGTADAVRLLLPETVQQVFAGETFADEAAPKRQGLTWYSNGELDGHPLWGHGGSDPGVNTSLLLLREKGLAAIVFTNTNGVSPEKVAAEIMREGLAV